MKSNFDVICSFFVCTFFLKKILKLTISSIVDVDSGSRGVAVKIREKLCIKSIGESFFFFSSRFLFRKHTALRMSHCTVVVLWILLQNISSSPVFWCYYTGGGATLKKKKSFGSDILSHILILSFSMGDIIRRFFSCSASFFFNH